VYTHLGRGLVHKTTAVRISGCKKLGENVMENLHVWDELDLVSFGKKVIINSQYNYFIAAEFKTNSSNELRFVIVKNILKVF
jgi:hypothetical protein